MTPLCKRFDYKNPRVWKLVPTDEEEVIAKELPGPEPAVPVAKREYFTQRRFDELTKKFGADYLRWFAGEALYTLLETDMDRSCEYCDIITEMFLEAAKVGQLVPRTNAIRAGLSIKVFADGYTSVPSVHPFNADSFDAFKRVFVVRRDIEQGAFKTLSNGSRKNEIFEKCFKEVSTKASYEIENCDEIEDFISRINKTTEKDDLSDLPPRLPFYKNAIRDRTYEFLVNSYVELIRNRAQVLMHPSDITDVYAKFHIFQSYESNLKGLNGYLVCDENRTSMAQLISKLAAAIKLLAAEIAAVKLDALGVEMDEAFIASSDFLNYVAHLKPAKVPRDTLERIGCAMCDSIKDMWPVFGSIAGPLLEGDSTDETSMHVILENFKALAKKMEALNMPHSVDPTLLQTLLARGLKVFHSGTSWTAQTDNERLFAAMNRAFVEFRGLDNMIPMACTSLVELSKAILTRNHNFRLSYLDACKHKLAEAEKKAVAQIRRYFKYARGKKNGKSWKEMITDAWALAKVLEHARTPVSGLVHGPGDFNEECPSHMLKVSDQEPGMNRTYLTPIFQYVKMCRR